jgi:nitrite reductase/ring-hydroxylating ferredoxin subunit
MSLIELEQFERKLADRPGPVLSDGTALRELFDLDKREVSMRVLRDPEVHRLELQRVFARSWVALGHVSELPNVGDFVLRSIGEDAVIVTRAADGSINALLNVCAHRGMEVCWADEGNQAQFKCPYHGWVFDGTGKLLGAPFEQEMYGDWDKSEFGLRTAKVDTRCGVIFGNFDLDAAPLDDWFGDFSWYFDVMMGDGHEMEVAGGVGLRMRVPANWKAAAEQNSGDGYHTVTLHHSLVELGLQGPSRTAQDWSLDCWDVSSYEGHGIRLVPFPEGNFLRPPGTDPEREFPMGWFMAGLMFPTSGVGGMVIPHPDMPDGRMRTANIGCMSPIGHGHYTGWNITLTQKGAPEGFKDMLLGSASTFSSIVTDDMESWPSMTRIANGAVGQEQTIKYNALLGPNNPEDFPGPGLVHRGFSKDDNQWHFWLRWFDMMTAPVA